MVQSRDVFEWTKKRKDVPPFQSRCIHTKCTERLWYTALRESGRIPQKFWGGSFDWSLHMLSAWWVFATMGRPAVCQANPITTSAWKPSKAATEYHLQWSTTHVTWMMLNRYSLLWLCQVFCGVCTRVQTENLETICTMPIHHTVVHMELCLACRSVRFLEAWPTERNPLVSLLLWSNLASSSTAQSLTTRQVPTGQIGTRSLQTHQFYVKMEKLWLDSNTSLPATSSGMSAVA